MSDATETSTPQTKEVRTFVINDKTTASSGTTPQQPIIYAVKEDDGVRIFSRERGLPEVALKDTRTLTHPRAASLMLLIDESSTYSK